MNSLVKRYLRDEAGATAIEYGLIAALISVGILGGLSAAGSTVKELFQRVVNAVTGL